MSNVNAITNEVLREGLDDWVMLDTLIWLAKEDSLQSNVDFRETVLSVLTVLIDEGLAEVGDLHDQGVRPWSGSTEDVVSRVAASCERLSWEPMGGVCWIANTPKGDLR